MPKDILISLIVILSLGMVTLASFFFASEELQNLLVEDKTNRIPVEGDTLRTGISYSFSFGDELKDSPNCAWSVNGEFEVFSEEIYETLFFSPGDVKMEVYEDHNLIAEKLFTVVAGHAIAATASIRSEANVGEEVLFEDQTPGAISWEWKVGETTSTERSFSMSFSSAQTVDVSLLVVTDHDTLPMISKSLSILKINNSDSGTSNTSSSTSSNSSSSNTNSGSTNTSSGKYAFHEDYSSITKMAQGNEFRAFMGVDPNVDLGCELREWEDQNKKWVFPITPKKLMAIEKIYLFSPDRAEDVEFTIRCTDCEDDLGLKAKAVMKYVNIDERNQIELTFRKFAGLRPGKHYELIINPKGRLRLNTLNWMECQAAMMHNSEFSKACSFGYDESGEGYLPLAQIHILYLD